MKIMKRNESEDARLPAARGDILGEVFSLRDAMDRLFDESFWSPFGRLAASTRGLSGLDLPRVDISESASEVKVRADLPGVDPDRVSIDVTEDTLAISGSFEKGEEEKGENYCRVERRTGQFAREFSLPAKVDPDSARATAKHGVVTVTLKKLASEQKKKVQVKPG